MISQDKTRHHFYISSSALEPKTPDKEFVILVDSYRVYTTMYMYTVRRPINMQYIFSLDCPLVSSCTLHEYASFLLFLLLLNNILFTLVFSNKSMFMYE